jgi:predicted nuclease of restriction endonuclease-like (RecB) superfamily
MVKSQISPKPILSMVQKVEPEGYESVLEGIANKIRAAQARAVKAVNLELVQVYREIGRTLHEKQQMADWGAAVVERLATDLRKLFPGVKGFSSRNLWRMKDFYSSYFEKEKLTAVLAEISWTHHVYILERCKDPLEREFYIRMSKKNAWSYRVLLDHIDNKTYERMMASQENFTINLPEQMRFEAKLAIKDEYIFDFLDIGDDYSERELKRALGKNIECFLREVGHAYTFIGTQYRLEIDGKEFFIDLLLYHRKLKSLVVIELKKGPFMPEYVGKMQFYLAVLNDTVRLADENPSIGIILCREKSRMIVEYALKDSNQPINVASYRIVKELPKELRDQLPTPKQIEKLLEYIE